MKALGKVGIAVLLILIGGCGKKPPEAPTPSTASSTAVRATNAAAVTTPAPPPQATGPLTRFDAKSGLGTKVRIEGTSTIHDWQVEGPLIGGFMEVGPGFPLEPGQAATPGKVEARVEAFIPVRSLKSVEKDGTPYSDKMNEVMFEKMKSQTYPKIFYRLTELVLKEPAKATNAPYVFDSKGELVVCGVTNVISMPVNILPMGEQKVKISGTVSVKMSSFKVEAPVLIGILSTGDDIKLIFDWIVVNKVPAAITNK